MRPEDRLDRADRHAAEAGQEGDECRPQLVLVSAGFDSRVGDPLGRFTLTDADFAELTAIVREIADRHAGGRIVSTLEGGYALAGLASAAAAHVTALM